MKVPSFLKKCSWQHALLIFTAWLAMTTTAVASTAPTEPRIKRIAFDGDALVITAEVPDHVDRLVLEGCENHNLRAWLPRAVRRILQAGEVEFRLPQSAARGLEMFRVRADDRRPLPAEFYAGPTKFRGSLAGTPGTGAWGPYFMDDAYFAAFGGPAAPNQELRVTTGGQASARSVVESDLWKISGDTLYFFNDQRGLQVINLANPDSPALAATLPLPASGEDMYLLDEAHVILLARARPCDWSANENRESSVVIVDVDGVPSELARVTLPGRIIESRLVGTALYVATETWQPQSDRPEDAALWVAGTLVTGIDLATPGTPVANPALWFPGSGNVVTATDRFLFVSTTDFQRDGRSDLRIIDITNPAGALREFGTIPISGRIPDKFKIHQHEDVLSVIAEVMGNGVANGQVRTELTTFRLGDPAVATSVPWARLGSVEVGRGENLFATRFDGDRAYIVTYRRIDPLWVVDLSTPETPRVLGELEIPGWSTYIHPLGDRLLTVGVDDTAGNRAAVQLFDVSDPASPRLLSKVAIGEGWSWSEANEDEKALGVFPEDGLVLLPFYHATESGTALGVKLIDLGPDTLTARGTLTRSDVVPRRSTVRGEQILALSARELVTVGATDRDQPVVENVLELAHSVDRVLPVGLWLLEFQGQSLRIRPVSGPDSLARTHALGELGVFGATALDDRIYVLQGKSPIQGWVENEWKAISPGRLELSVYDANALPDLVKLGSATTEQDQVLDGQYNALWPRPDVLVWDAQQTYSFWGWDSLILMPPVSFAGPVDLVVGAGSEPNTVQVRLNVSAGMIDFAAPWGMPRLWAPPMDRALVVYDVALPNAPRFVSRIAMPEDAVQRGDAFSANGLVFFSHDTHQVETIGTNTQVTLERQFISEPREVLVTNIVRVPYETLVTNVVEERVVVAGWFQPLIQPERVVAGRYHALALSRSGTLAGWGDNRAGQLGLDDYSILTSTEEIPLGGTVTHFAAAAWFSLARLADGSVWTWGSPDGPPPPPLPGLRAAAPPHVAQAVSGLPTDIAEMDAGHGHVVVRTASGAVFAWGSNELGQLGTGDRESRVSPAEIASGFAAVSAAGHRTAGLRGDGRVFAWGDNRLGQLGDGPGDDALQPREVAGLPSTIRAIHAGDTHTLALDAEGRVWSWGSASGREASTAAHPVASLPPMQSIAAGRFQSVALDPSGKVWSWGSHSPTPLPMEDLPEIASIDANATCVLALGVDETCYIWSHDGNTGARTALPRRYEMARTTVTNVVPGIAYHYTTNVTTKIIDQGHWVTVSVTNHYPIQQIRTLHHLDVVDLSGNPVVPVKRPAVSLPGALQGISHGGDLVYTVATRTGEGDKPSTRTWLEAGAYDGTAVHLVTSLEIADPTAGDSVLTSVDPRGVIVLARRDSDGTNTLGTLMLNTTGTFEVIALKTLEGLASELEIRDGLVAVTASGVLWLYDLGVDAGLYPTGTPFDLGCLIPTLDRLAGDRLKGLWVPLGAYGSAPVWQAVE